MLIVGDAFVTTNQESVYSAVTQDPEMHGPPMYFTPDWATAKLSVRKLAALAPETVVSGHGRAMYGAAMREQLRDLAVNFDRIMPAQGRYVPYPAVADERGVVHVPPRVRLTNGSRAAVAIAAALVGFAVMAAARSRQTVSP